MTAAITLMAKRRSGPQVAAQVLFYAVTDASFDTDSYHQFAEGYFLRAMPCSGSGTSKRVDVTATRYEGIIHDFTDAQCAPRN
jgi:hypothetical protein